MTPSIAAHRQPPCSSNLRRTSAETSGALFPPYNSLLLPHLSKHRCTSFLQPQCRTQGTHSRCPAPQNPCSPPLPGTLSGPDVLPALPAPHPIPATITQDHTAYEGLQHFLFPRSRFTEYKHKTRHQHRQPPPRTHQRPEATHDSPTSCPDAAPHPQKLPRHNTRA